MISCQDNQDGHLRRGPLHLQAQREGQEGQVVHEEPGQILKTNPLKKNHSLNRKVPGISRIISP